MKKFSKNSLAAVVTIMLLSLASCSKLDTKIKDPNSVQPPAAGTAPAPSSLSKLYEQLNQLLGQGNAYAMEEHTTDEILGPTRGTDWDDFGTWRKLHLHTWDGSHNQINDTWNGINGALFQTTLLAESTTASAGDKAAAKFLRAYFTYYAMDLFGQVQHRPATAAANVIPDVWTRSEACDAAIAELESIVSVLPSYNHTNRDLATKEAAEFLLAKLYLNKAVYKNDPTKPAGPFTFAQADMNKVISLCNDIAANPNLSISNNYWDNFVWDNGTKSTENLFVRKNSGGINVTWATCMGGHYNMVPSGWNGFTTLADFYNSFEDNDSRKSDTIPGLFTYTGSARDNSIFWDPATKTTSYRKIVGRGAGFLVGQQQGPQFKNPDGSVSHKIGDPIQNLTDRSGNPLKFTPDVSLFFSNEVKGIRTNKYPLDPAQINDGGNGSQNDYVFFRFADVRLMKAEAILRGGSDAETPLSIVNSIRAKRNATPLASIDLAGLLAERGRELYLEAWRRNDMVRFGVFNAPVGERPVASDPSRCVFPIPTIALSSNPNLKQNYGY